MKYEQNKEIETVLKFCNHLTQLADSLKNMAVEVSESELSTALLNGLPDEYQSLISALDALGDDESHLKWNFIKSRLLQEEQRIQIRNESETVKKEDSAMMED